MIKIGLCGLGTVGASFIEHIKNNYQLIKSNVGSDFQISAIADRSIDKKDHDTNLLVTKNALELAENPELDIIVELIGNVEVSYELLRKSLNNNKHVITANKALIAKHGEELFLLAQKKEKHIGFEASVAGAIPIIQTLRNNFTNEKINSVVGIINGTSNFILDKMSNTSCEFSSALSEAQSLGYAESDPSFDINGQDAAHKIAILSSLAFGVKPPLDDTYVEGIDQIMPMDINYADELGYVIKHVGITELIGHQIISRVHPVLVPKGNIFAHVSGVMNAVIVEGERFGKSMLYGHGAGGSATASAVVSDLVKAININKSSGGNLCPPISTGNKLDIRGIDEVLSQYYLRIFADDVPGVMAEITNRLAQVKISIEAVTQHAPTDSSLSIPIVMITNNIKYSLVKSVINEIENMPHINGEVFCIRLLDDNG